MRYLRLFPLLVMAFAAPAAADDHRMDLSFAGGYASGSNSVGMHGTVAVRARHPKLTGVGDVSYHDGSRDGENLTRKTILFGARWTHAVSEGSSHKLLPQVLAGWVGTNVGEASTDWVFGFAPGLGYEYIRESPPGSGPAVGFRAHLDYVITKGPETGYVRLSAGVIYRFK